MDKVEAYCMKCKQKREMVDPKKVTFGKKGRQAYKGKCKVCGTNMFRII